MRKLIAFIVFATAACVDSPDVREATTEAAVEPPESTRWFLGTWDCPNKFYRSLPPFYKEHTVNGVLTFADVSKTEVDVTWTETFVSGFESRPIDFTGRLVVSPPNASGVSGVSMSIRDTDGATFEGIGRSQGQFRGIPSILGILSLHPFEAGGSGVFTFPGHAPRLASFNLFGTRGVNGAPDQTTFGRTMENPAGSGSLGDYFPAQRCFRRP